MRTLRVAMTVIEQDKAYVLQLRDSIPEKGGAGLVGCFGGQIEENETPQAAAARELGEETTLQLRAEELRQLGTVDVTSDRDNQPVRIQADIFHVRISPTVAIQAKEGKIVYLEKDGASHYLERMTTGTRAAFRELILKENQDVIKHNRP